MPGDTIDSRPDTNVTLNDLRREYAGRYDIFAAGIILYAWAEGRDGPPLRAMNTADLKRQILADAAIPEPRQAS